MSIRPGSTGAGRKDSRMQVYRQVERSWWEHHDIDARERFVETVSPPARLRVLEVGSGEPVLFIHGTAGAGPIWAPVARELPGFRCLMLDRPGWGMSSPVRYAKQGYRALVADLVRDTLDGLGIERAHVVGASIGDTWALSMAEHHPSRVDRVVLVGGGPLVPEVAPPVFIRLLASPLGVIMARLPQNEKMTRAQLQQVGHGPTLDAGQLEEFIKWRVALTAATPSMRPERDMVRAITSWRSGFRPALTFSDHELARITQPTLFVYGTADPVGSIDIWTRTVDVLPHGQLHLVEGAGHVPWLDDPKGVGGEINQFLSD